ncbi:DUF2073 domain-containing protein [Candidatus Woesearchaeota archaeon]|nr:DUF2073 domain-containing protein [Candidatus Woesearchaeota archaeon]
MLILQFMPFDEIASLSSDKRVSKLLEIVKENKILLLEGRLRKEEEAELIKKTMETIDDDFKGIEIGVIYPKDKDKDFLNKIRENMINLLLGDRRGFTIMGPATIVKEIKQDPNKIQLFTTSYTPKS